MFGATHKGDLDFARDLLDTTHFYWDSNAYKSNKLSNYYLFTHNLNATSCEERDSIEKNTLSPKL